MQVLELESIKAVLYRFSAIPSSAITERFAFSVHIVLFSPGARSSDALLV